MLLMHQKKSSMDLRHLVDIRRFLKWSWWLDVTTLECLWRLAFRCLVFSKFRLQYPLHACLIWKQGTAVLSLNFHYHHALFFAAFGKDIFHFFVPGRQNIPSRLKIIFLIISMITVFLFNERLSSSFIMSTNISVGNGVN